MSYVCLPVCVSVCVHACTSYVGGTVPPESICTLARVNRKGRTREGPRGSRDETVRFTRRNRAVHETKPRLNISRGQKDEAQTQ